MYKSVTINWHTFLTDGLSPSWIIVDAGANFGAFSQGVKKRLGVSTIAIEPQPAVADRLRQLGCSRVVECALSDSDETALFNIFSNSEASSLSAINTEESVPQEKVWVRTVSLLTFMKEVGISSIDVLKLDIEGAEISVLKNVPDECLRNLKQITVEYHDFRFPSHAREISVIDAFLKSKGFAKIRLSILSNMNVLYVNRRYFDISTLNMQVLRLQSAIRIAAHKIQSAIGS